MAATLDRSKVSEIEQQGRDVPILGFSISWQVQKVLIGVDDLKPMLEKHGFHKAASGVAPIRTGSAVARALTEMKNAGMVREEQDDSMVRRNEAGQFSVFVLVVENADRDRAAQDVNFRYRTALKVRLNKHPKPGEDALSFSSPQAEAVLRPMIERYKTAYTSRDITHGVLWEIIGDEHACKYVRQGGAYFMPAANREHAEDVVRRLRAFLDELADFTGRECYLVATRQINDAEARKDMSRVAHASMLGDLRQEAKYLREMASDDRSVKQDTILNHLKAVEDLANRAGLYQDVLELRAGDVAKQIRDLKAALQELMIGAKPSKDAAVAAEANAIAREAKAKKDANPEVSAVAASLKAAAQDDEGDDF